MAAAVTAYQKFFTTGTVSEVCVHVQKVREETITVKARRVKVEEEKSVLEPKSFTEGPMSLASPT